MPAPAHGVVEGPVHASRKRKPPIQRQLGGGGSGMPAGTGSRPSSASSGAVEGECKHEAGTKRAKTVVLSDCDSDPIPSSAVPSDHSSAVPSDDDTPASSAVPSDHDSDVSRPPVWTGIISPLDFAVKELGPLLQDRDLKSCGCPRGCWEAIVEDVEALSLWRSFEDDFGQLKKPDEKEEADALLLDMLKHCGPKGGPSAADAARLYEHYLLRWEGAGVQEGLEDVPRHRHEQDGPPARPGQARRCDSACGQ